MIHRMLKYFGVIAFVFVVVSEVRAQKPPYDVFPPAEPPYYRVRYEPSTKPGELAFGVNYTIWIPENVKSPRGVIVHQHGCGEGSCKSGLTGAYDLHWQALARKHDCALLSPSYEQPEGADCQLWCDPRNGSDASFRRALADLGEKSGRPGLATVPWALWGHSGGGHWAGGMTLLHPDRVAAAWLRSGVPLLKPDPARQSIKAHGLPDAALAVPMMCNLGTKEGVTVKDSRFAGVWPANEAFFNAVRSKGGLVGVAIDPLTSHECGNQRYFAIPWLDACLTARLPKSAGDPLQPMPTDQAWLAPVAGSEAVPASRHEGDPLKAAWLPSEAVARAWMQYVKDSAVIDVTPPPSPTNLRVNGNELTWEAEADLESGLARFVVERDGEFLANLPEQGRNPYGRPIFQNLQYSDTPTQPLVPMRYVDDKAVPGKAHAYRVVAENTAGLRSRPAESSKSVRRETLMVPMRDGVRLATDVYRDPSIRRSSAVLMRTPYNKAGGRAAAERFAAAGYVAIVQDCRGKFASEGAFIPYDNEGQDGYDAIEWIGKQPWCDGRIGMWGASYVGATQWQAAVEHPPGLTTITPTATWSSFHRNLYLGGALRLSLIAKWAAGNMPNPKGAKLTDDWNRALSHLPLSEVDDQTGRPIPSLEGMLTHPTPDGYWKRVDLTNDLAGLKLPMQHVVGYYDFFSRESVGNFVRMRKAADSETRERQQLILGPWDHGTIGKSKVGELDFGPEAEWDATGATLEWFDRYLKRDSSALSKPLVPVRYFVLGENRWRHAEEWPPAGFRATSFHLRSEGHANTAAGDGRLTREAPSNDEPADSFRSDPADPAPACPVSDKLPLHAAVWAPMDQRAIESRNDVLVYSTEPMREPLTFAGDAFAELYVSADAPDADWVVALVDVRPDGAAHNLAVGILRGRFRESELLPKPLRPGEVYKIKVDLGPIAARISPGHRLRVDVRGAYFPLFDRNPNTGEGPFGNATRIASETVHHSAARPSRVVLPVATN